MMLLIVILTELDDYASALQANLIREARGEVKRSRVFLQDILQDPPLGKCHGC